MAIAGEGTLGPCLTPSGPSGGEGVALLKRGREGVGKSPQGGGG
jgi:hypothetical protein